MLVHHWMSRGRWFSGLFCRSPWNCCLPNVSLYFAVHLLCVSITFVLLDTWYDTLIMPSAKHCEMFGRRQFHEPRQKSPENHRHLENAGHECLRTTAPLDLLLQVFNLHTLTALIANINMYFIYYFLSYPVIHYCLSGINGVGLLTKYEWTKIPAYLFKSLY